MQGMYKEIAEYNYRQMETGKIQYGGEEVEDLETQEMQGTQEEANPRNASPETVANPREESEQCKMGIGRLIIF